MTALVVAALAHTAGERDRQAFEAAARAAQDAVTDRVGTSVALLRAAAGLFVTQPRLSVTAFAAYMRSIELRERYSGILGIGYTRRIDPREIAAVEAEMRAQGHEGFRVWPTEPRDEVHSIVLLEPLDARNRSAIGYDMYTNPIRRAGMARARDTGVPASTQIVELVQETHGPKQPGFLIYVPVYAGGGIPASLAERRERLLGFAYSPIRAGDFLSAAFVSPPPIGVAVYQGAEARPESLLYAHAPGDIPARSRFVRTSRVEVAGETWTFEFRSAQAPGGALVMPSVVAAAGIALSLLLAVLIRREETARLQLDAARRRREDALRDEAHMLETLNRVGRSVAGELDLQRTVQAVTDAATELSGARFGAFFYNVATDSGESYRLYALAGAPREAFDRFGTPRNTPLFATTFAGREVVRVDDVTKDPRYGRNPMHQGVPQGHLPVKSYMAAPVVSRSGEVIGGLFFGHPSPGIFTERAERLVTGIAAQAAVAIDNARLYERTRHLVDQLREADRRKDEFLATLSHELRNPLAPLANALQLLRMGGSSVDAARLHEMMERQVRNLMRLVDDLLELSRITRGTFELRKERVDVVATVRTAVETSEPLIRAAGHRLELDLPPEPLWLDGDPVRLAQILSNLLNNAANYTPRGGTLRVRARGEAGEAVISVRDNGAGIAPERLEGLFEMFSKGDHSSGLGIGLALARRLAQMHGGTLEAASEGVGKGAEFTVRLPLAVEQRAEAADTPVARTPSPGRRVLVVDDNRDAAESLGMLLESLGADVRVVYDGASAIREFETYRPGIVLLDIGMPGMDGHEVARRLRSRVNGEQVSLVAVTGWGQAQDREQSRAAGFDLHLTKPVDPESLRQLLSSPNVRDSGVA